MNIVKEKSTELGILINAICMHSKTKVSANVIDAMIREAEFAESKKDFIHKMSIAQKEVNESLYWIDILLSQENENHNEIIQAQSLAKDIFFILLAINRKAKKGTN
jgi:four helix bundle protein